MAKHLLHLGFLLAVGALALKAAFMPPRLQASLRPGEHAMLDGDILVLKGFSVPKYPSGKPRQYESDVHVVSVARGADEAAKHVAVVKNMADGEQSELPETEIFEFLRQATAEQR